MINFEVQKSDTYGVMIPPKTESYIPVPNRVFIEEVETELKKRGISVQKESYTLSGKGNIMTGKMQLEMGDDDLQMTIGLMNSYDKSKKLGIGAGGNVIICDNGMFISDFQKLRKHTGDVLETMHTMIQNTLQYITDTLEDLQYYKAAYKEIQVKPSVVHELIGEMFMQEDLLRSTQLNRYKEYANADANPFKGDSLWDFYNNITEVYKLENPFSYFSTHIDFQDFITNKFNINDKREETIAVPDTAISI